MGKLISVFAISTVLTLSVSSTQVLASGDHDEEHVHPVRHGSGHHHDHHDEKGPVGFSVDASQVQKVVHVTLADNMTMTFKEKLASIKSGTVIKFKIRNEGHMPHEFSINDQEGQQEHAAMMRKMPGMVHNDGNTLTVQPGEARSLTWKFEGNELVVFACNIPGHYEAGMFQKIELKK